MRRRREGADRKGQENQCLEISGIDTIFLNSLEKQGMLELYTVKLERSLDTTFLFKVQENKNYIKIRNRKTLCLNPTQRYYKGKVVGGEGVNHIIYLETKK